MEEEIPKWVPRKKLDVSDVENVTGIIFENEEQRKHYEEKIREIQQSYPDDYKCSCDCHHCYCDCNSWDFRELETHVNDMEVELTNFMDDFIERFNNFKESIDDYIKEYKRRIKNEN